MNTEKHAMNTPTVYRVINKSDNKVQHFREARLVAAHLLGRRISNLIVIKSDDAGDRLIQFTSADVAQCERELTPA
jgi:hypothetical protein